MIGRVELKEQRMIDRQGKCVVKTEYLTVFKYIFGVQKHVLGILKIKKKMLENIFLYFTVEYSLNRGFDLGVEMELQNCHYVQVVGKWV